MLSDEITSVAGAYKKRKRLGRGRGTGHGKTCGRGHKGSGSRTGSFARPTYEGGQMPLFRRMPKRGFNNANFTKRYEVVNVSQLERFFNDGAVINIEQLVAANLVDNASSRVKILGDGELTKKLEVTAHKFSKTAEQKIADCGGTARVVA
ncbi:MAG TPA: 50S ribosomal protein L15 [Anaerohalosphaeraceae bacterium]|jgi:large subunit ribosomal protein L15|nr:50S ribosomal protein L15 [Anaerohalosphaeraceae bacterium]HRT49222.1 50S ribosomal protein L15 [Anaerohalosphaeraceae bacterium]HRT85239.1 50S ribosomal protein L15 [Anaerohalosphaeraceae bacterium]